MKKEVKIPSDADTKIAKSSTITGSIEVIGTLLVDGRIEGNIKSHDNIFIGKTAVVNGDLVAKNAFVFGIIQGNVKVDGSIYLAASSKLFGDVTAQSLTLEKGCVYKGVCQTSENIRDMNSINELDSGKGFSELKEESVIESL